MAAIRYRNGIDSETGKLISGAAHLSQCLATIWTTHLDQYVMELDFGLALRSHLAEDITPATALDVYHELVVSADLWEPEYAITKLQLVILEESGKLGLQHYGLYYPEGRFGNYDIAVPLNATLRSLRGT